jgi:hypothetical protein
MFLKYLRLHCKHYINESNALAGASRTRRRRRTAHRRRRARDAAASAGFHYCSVSLLETLVSLLKTYASLL